jgi:predicted methyltransferase
MDSSNTRERNEKYTHQSIVDMRPLTARTIVVEFIGGSGHAQAIFAEAVVQCIRSRRAVAGSEGV